MLKLHFAPNSRAGRILWLLEELELPYELNKMAFSPTDLKSDEHRARHPLGRVPVLDLRIVDGERYDYSRNAFRYSFDDPFNIDRSTTQSLWRASLGIQYKF